MDWMVLAQAAKRDLKMDGCSLRHLIADGAVREPGALRFLAAWYRDYAERTDNPAIWEARLATAETLEQEAARLQDRANCNRHPNGPAAKQKAPRQTSDAIREP